MNAVKWSVPALAVMLAKAIIFSWKVIRKNDPTEYYAREFFF